MAGDRSPTPGCLDAVVVGAGVSGLAVARDLVESGRSVAVLEAADRVGGRLRSVSAGGGRVDLGATWFWPGERRVSGLVADLGVRIHHQHLAGDVIYDAPDGPTRIEGNPIDVASFRFTDGADSLTGALATRLPAGTIRCSHAVYRIDLTGAEVVVHAGASRFRSRTAVLAVPPAVGVARIEFVPTLPELVADLARAVPVWMGSMTKVVAVYPEPFWRADGRSGSGVSHRGPLREIHDTSGPTGAPAALFGFAPGDVVVERGAVLEQLARMFGAPAAEPVELHLADWGVDAVTAPAGVGSSTAYHLFGHPTMREALFDHRVVWASTETGAEAPGHVEGALEAAEHAVRTVLGTLERPSTPTPGGPT